MKLGVIFFAVIVTTAQAQTAQQAQFYPMRDTRHVALTDTQCLIVTIPGFDPQTLTPGQVARMRAIMVDGNPASLAGHAGTANLPVPIYDLP